MSSDNSTPMVDGPISAAELAALKEGQRLLAQRLSAITVRCGTCCHGAAGTGSAKDGTYQPMCRKYGPVPADVYPVGCPEWAWDGIPF
jgi:hypothetical protein